MIQVIGRITFNLGFVIGKLRALDFGSGIVKERERDRERLK